MMVVGAQFSFFMLIALAAFIIMMLIGLRMLLGGKKRLLAVLALAGLVVIPCLFWVKLLRKSSGRVSQMSYTSAHAHSGHSHSGHSHSEPAYSHGLDYRHQDGISFRNNYQVESPQIVIEPVESPGHVAPTLTSEKVIDDPAIQPPHLAEVFDVESDQGSVEPEVPAIVVSPNETSPSAKSSEKPAWVENGSDLDSYDGMAATVVSSPASTSPIESEFEINSLVAEACRTEAGRVLKNQGLFDVWPIDLSEKMINAAKRDMWHEVTESEYGTGHSHHQLLVFGPAFEKEVLHQRNRARVGERLKTAGVATGATLSGLLALFGGLSFVQFRRDRKGKTA